MKIEIYLKTLTQEYFDTKPGVKWWPSVHTSIPNAWKRVTDKITDSSKPLSRIIIREEDFGSIIYDPLSQAVLKADKVGTTAIYDLLNGANMEDCIKKFNISKNEAQEFFSVLEELGLW